MIDPALLWCVIGLMVFFLQLAVPGFILYFFALGALITALVFRLAEIDVAWQLGLFMSISLISLAVFWRIIPRRSSDNSPKNE